MIRDIKPLQQSCHLANTKD